MPWCTTWTASTKLAVAAISKRRWRLPARSGRPDLNEAVAIYNLAVSNLKCNTLTEGNVRK